MKFYKETTKTNSKDKNLVKLGLSSLDNLNGGYDTYFANADALASPMGDFFVEGSTTSESAITSEAAGYFDRVALL